MGSATDRSRGEFDSPGQNMGLLTLLSIEIVLSMYIETQSILRYCERSFVFTFPFIVVPSLIECQSSVPFFGQVFASLYLTRYLFKALALPDQFVNSITRMTGQTRNRAQLNVSISTDKRLAQLKVAKDRTCLFFPDP